MSKKSLVGDLHSMSLADVFQWISLSNKTGELVMQCESEDSSIMFFEGKIVYAFANNPDFLMGQLLLQYHKINKTQLIKALGVQKKQKKPLGQVLNELKVLSKSDLEEIVQIQIHQVIYHLLNWEAGFFRFEEKNVTLNTQTAIASDSLLMEGMRRLDERKNILNFMKYDSIPEMIDDDDEHPLFELVDGENTVNDIMKNSGGDPYLALETLYRGLRENKLKIIGEKEGELSEDPVIKFLVALELFNKGKIHESFQHISNIISSGYNNEQVIKFYENLKMFISRYFIKKYGGNNSCFDLNRLRLLDEKIYITPAEGYILSRIEESPCINMLAKVVTVEIEELYLVVDKLYKLGLLLLKTKEKNKSEVMKLNIVESMLDALKREMTGEMEVTTKNGSMSIFFVSGKIKFIYSLSDKYSIKEHLSAQDSLNIHNDDKEGLESFFEKVMENNGLSISDLAPILEVYQAMVFYEIVPQEPISIVFIHDSEFTLNFNIKLNLLYMLVFAIINNSVRLNNEIEFSCGYELLQPNERVLDEFGGVSGMVAILEKFYNSIINVSSLKELGEKELSILNILHRLGYLRESTDMEFSINELKDYLEMIRNQSPSEVFSLPAGDIDFDDVKQKYLKLTKKYHPDLYPDDGVKKIAKDIFEAIKFAYDGLKDKNDYNQSSQEHGMKIDAKKIFLAEQLMTSGNVYLNMGRLPDAVDAFIKAYENYPDDDEIKAFYGLSQIRIGKTSEGFAIMKGANFQQFHDVNLYLAYVDAAIKLKKNDDARKVIDKAFIKFPDHIKRFVSMQNRIK